MRRKKIPQVVVQHMTYTQTLQLIDSIGVGANSVKDFLRKNIYFYLKLDWSKLGPQPICPGELDGKDHGYPRISRLLD